MLVDIALFVFGVARFSSLEKVSVVANIFLAGLAIAYGSACIESEQEIACVISFIAAALHGVVHYLWIIIAVSRNPVESTANPLVMAHYRRQVRLLSFLRLLVLLVTACMALMSEVRNEVSSVFFSLCLVLESLLGVLSRLGCLVKVALLRNPLEGLRSRE